MTKSWKENTPTTAFTCVTEHSTFVSHNVSHNEIMNSNLFGHDSKVL